MIASDNTPSFLLGVIGTRSFRRFGFSVAVLTAVSAIILGWVSNLPISWDVFLVAAVIFSFIVALYWALAATGVSDDPSKTVFRSALVIWMFLLDSEELFSRSAGDLQSALREQFSVTAYGELGLWIVALVVFVVLSFRSPRYVHNLFRGHYRWLSLLCVLCAISTIQSPRPLYSMAWGFKLCLVVVLLGMCSPLICDPHRRMAFLRATLFACLFYLFVEVYLGFTDPLISFEGGRFGQSSNSLSVISGTVLILSLVFRSQSPRVWPIFLSVFAAIIMILSGGKAGIVSGALSATLYYLTKKKVGSAIALPIGMACLGLALYAFTPLGSNLNAYAEQGEAETLTGRTDLWVAALPVIQQRPVLGHGYLASRFAATDLDWERAGMRWEADHLHNAYLDVLYNNGVIGLTLVLILHGIIIRNLLYAIRCQRASPELRNLAAGSLAVFANLVISAFFNSTIGGRASTLFMLFLAIFVVSESLRREVQKYPDRVVDGSLRRNLTFLIRHAPASCD